MTAGRNDGAPPATRTARPTVPPPQPDRSSDRFLKENQARDQELPERRRPRDVDRTPQPTTSLLQRHGAEWTHSLAINDLYFDFMGPSLAAAGIPGDGAPINVAAGDGSESAYQRVRSGRYRAVTVAEPLTLQGWQLVDEMNRALAGEEWSGYVSPLHVVTEDNIEFDGGPDNTFDPDNGYKEAYGKIWSGG